MWTADKLMYNGVSYDAAYSGDTLIWTKRNYEDEYFTLEVVSGGTLGWGLVDATAQVTTAMLEYSLNGGEWTDLSTSIPLNVSAGDSVRIKNPSSWYDYYKIYGMHFYGTAYFNACGNIMSLVYNNFSGKKVFPETDSYIKDVFRGSNVVDASNLILPVTAVTYSCYSSLFEGSSLVTAPEVLPATSLVGTSYAYMFSECRSLTKAPIIQATSVGFGSCEGMFRYCTHLTQAPTLLAPALPRYAYHNMFKGCTSLNSVTCLATNIADLDSTFEWLYGVSATGTFTKASSMTGWSTGVDGIPSGWTVVDA